MSPRGIHLHSSVKQEAARLYAGGISQVDIGQQLGITQTTVSKIIIQMGLSKRVKRECKPEPSNRGEPICKVCHLEYSYSVDTIYGATLETCTCGVRVLSRGWQAA